MFQQKTLIEKGIWLEDELAIKTLNSLKNDQS